MSKDNKGHNTRKQSEEDEKLERLYITINGQRLPFSPRRDHPSTKDGRDKWVAKSNNAEGELHTFHNPPDSKKYFYRLGRDDHPNVSKYENHQHSNYKRHAPYTPDSTLVGYITSPRNKTNYGVFQEEQIKLAPSTSNKTHDIKSNFLKADQLQYANLTQPQKDAIQVYLSKHTPIQDSEYAFDENDCFRVVDEETISHDKSARGALERASTTNIASQRAFFQPGPLQLQFNSKAKVLKAPQELLEKAPQELLGIFEYNDLFHLRSSPRDSRFESPVQEMQGGEEESKQNYAHGGSVTMDDLYDALAHTISPYPYSPQPFFSNTGPILSGGKRARS